MQRKRVRAHPTSWFERSGGRRLTAATVLGLAAALLGGCNSMTSLHNHFFGHAHEHHQPITLLPNPLYVPVTNPDFVWDQLVDAIDDYFRIEREERVRVVGDVITEGTLTTIPAIGATYLEPWRGDSTHGFERLQSSLQTIRRFATARVMPAGQGFYIEVIVAKELEDLFQPENAPVGGTFLRHDGTVIRSEARPRSGAVSLGWIPQGRDVALEQRILVDLQSRLSSHP